MELTDLMNESIKMMENDFYTKKFYFSYSSLNKLMWNPQAFYQAYVLGNREEKVESYLVNGKIIHRYDKITDTCICYAVKVPSDFEWQLAKIFVSDYISN